MKLTSKYFFWNLASAFLQSVYSEAKLNSLAKSQSRKAIKNEK